MGMGEGKGDQTGFQNGSNHSGQNQQFHEYGMMSGQSVHGFQ
jgi:hypothetical protein